MPVRREAEKRGFGDARIPMRLLIFDAIEQSYEQYVHAHIEEEAQHVHKN
jgi:hypothetical protein